MNRGRTALLVAAGAGFGAVALGFVIELVRRHFVRDDVNARYVTLAAACVLVAIAIGTATAVRRPHARCGWLLTIAGAGAACGVWRLSAHPVIAALALAVFYATALLPLHALVVQGDAVGHGTRRFLVGADIVLAVLGLVIVTTAESGVIEHWFTAIRNFRHVENPFVVSDAPGLARAAQSAWWITILAVGTVATVLRLRTWLRSPRNVRRRGTLIASACVGWLLMLSGAALTLFIDRRLGARVALADFGVVLLPLFGLALAAGAIGWSELVEPRLSRRASGRVELSAIEPDRSGVRALLADVLGTPNVGILYSRNGQWIDAAGRSADPTRDRRVATIVRQDGAEIAAILHEAEVPLEVVQLGARITASQLDAELATPRARGRAEAVRVATAELVRAGDRAALALAAEMDDGPLPRLARLSARLRTDPDAIADAAGVLQEITASVRALSHGLVPRELEDGGLSAVLDGRCRTTQRFSRAVEITVYLLAHDDPAARVDEVAESVVVTRTTAVPPEAAARTAALGGRVEGTVATIPRQ